MAGVAIGSALAGRAGDRFGRRRTLLLFLAGGAAATSATAFASSHVELIVWRTLTGIGLGGTIPLALALSAEYIPRRVRLTLLAIITSATPLGSALASLLAPSLIDAWGWQAVFVAGAVAPLVALVLAAGLLPESVRWLAMQRGQSIAFERLVRAIDPAVSIEHRPVERVAQAEARSTAKALFAHGRAAPTVLLWVMFLGNQSILLLLGSWLPTLLIRLELSRDDALYATTIYSIGGMLSGPLLGWLCDRYRPLHVLLGTYSLATVAVSTMASTVDTLPLLAGIALLAGAGVSGSQIALNAFAANLYPTVVRATGIGWALGVGRIGAITSPLLAGSMLASGWSSHQVLLAAAVAPVICAMAVAMLGRLQAASSQRVQEESQ
jgi:AAHS family 4-hydroxybenzoate transporter-like MFS transporter